MTDTTISIEEARQRLHEIVRKDIPFDEKARESLELARRCLGVDSGFLTRIDQETDHWEIETTAETADGEAPSGLEMDLRKTYCRETIENNAPLALHDAPNQGWTGDPAFELNENHTYLGTPLILKNKPYGTVCFVAEKPRSKPFSDAETLFAEHLTRLLERELEREQVEAELTSQTKLAAVLNRALRHNLRNDTAVIWANIQQIAEQLPNEPAIKTTYDHVDSLLNLSEKARELEQIVTSDIDRKPTDVGSLVNDVVETVAQEHPHASFSIEYDEDVSAALRPSFERAIRELLENAVEHSGETPTVSVTIDTVPNAVEIQIADDGPGIPDMEAEVLTTGEETQLSHGSGLGLWLIHWIVTGHDGSIDTTVTESGTIITLSVPRSPKISIQQQTPEITRGRDRFHAAFEEAQDTILILDDEARILNSNTAAETLFGLASKELLGRPLTEFVSGTFDFEAEWRDFQQSGSTRGTVPLIDADGSEHVVEYSGRADIVTGEHVFVGRDITEREKREQELRRTERRLSIALEAANAGVWEWDIQSETIVWDETMERILGLEPGSFEGTFGAFFERTHPDDRETLQSTVEDAIEQGKTAQWAVRLAHEDGGYRWIDTRVQVVADSNGAPRWMIGVGIDITERKERQRELTVTKERYETLLAAAPDPVCVADAETGEIIEVNEAAEALIGEPREQLIGRHQTTFHPTEDADLYREAFKRAKGERTIIRTLADGSRLKLKTADGETVPTEISVDTVALPSGPVIYGIFRDLSDRDDREMTLE